MIVKQQAGDHQKCAVRIVKDDLWQDTTQNLAENGYTEGLHLHIIYNIMVYFSFLLRLSLKVQIT
jgi:hypothetical protein